MVKLDSMLNFNKMRKDLNHKSDDIKTVIKKVPENNPNKPSDVHSYFHDLEKKVLVLIEESTYVIGCVAWLTNDSILDALAKKKGVKIVVNKEEYLRPDTRVGKRDFYRKLRMKYNELDDLFKTDCVSCSKPFISCEHFVKIFPNIKTEDLIGRDGAVLSCGIVNNFSKMHHKFLLFFGENFEPKGVWTGSFNLSNNSNYCLENALYVTNPIVFKEYLLEFEIIYSFSECYKWESGLLCKMIE
jgi:hypothetical protein